MSAPNEFDDLARRKLAEREHPFDEAAWEALRPALDAQRKRKRRLFVLWFTLLLGVGATGWWLTQRAATVPTADATANTPDHTHTVNTAAVQDTAAHAPRATTGSAAVTDTQRSSTTDNTPHSALASNEATSTPAQQAKNASATKPDIPTDATAVNRPRPSKGSTAPESSNAGHTPTIGSINPTLLTDGALVINTTSTTPPPATPAPRSSDTTTTADHTAPLPQVTSLPVDPAHPSPKPTVVPADSFATVTIASSDTAQYVIAMDTLVTADTTAALPPASQRRLELSVWGGPFLTRTHYSGDRTADWASTVSGNTSFAFGAEMMRHSEHFGFGLGLHYATYAEQLEAQALQEEHRAWVTNYHLDPVDTTLLVVNGTVWINDQQYYITYTLDTTIYVLVGTTSEEVTTNVRRNALQRSNRTSYLELPLLFEAHTRRGPWSFALRGGPTLGILQGRRGTLPTTTGYTDLNDEAFSAMVLGYTLQGHVRYHFGELWSVGVGPSVRGQLMNGVQSTGLQRRSNATGAVISVGYHLP